MVEDYEVDLHVLTAKKKLLKSDTKNKTYEIYFGDFVNAVNIVNAVHNFVNAVHNSRSRHPPPAATP